MNEILPLPIWLKMFTQMCVNLMYYFFQRYPSINNIGVLICNPLFIIIGGCAGTILMRRMLDYWKLSSTIHKNLSNSVFAASIGKWKRHLFSGQQAYILYKNYSGIGTIRVFGLVR